MRSDWPITPEMNRQFAVFSRVFRFLRQRHNSIRTLSVFLWLTSILVYNASF